MKPETKSRLLTWAGALLVAVFGVLGTVVALHLWADHVLVDQIRWQAVQQQQRQAQPPAPQPSLGGTK